MRLRYQIISLVVLMIRKRSYVTSALIILSIFFAIYCSFWHGKAGARLFETLFHLPYQTALWLGAFATIGYVCIGGFLAPPKGQIRYLMIFALLLYLSSHTCL